MTFSRDDLANYEKQPQTAVDDTQARAADKEAGDAQAAEQAAKEAALAAKNAKSAATADTNNSVEDPSGDEVDTGDQSETGDGTSDENADSSTAPADPSGDSDTSEEAARQPPKKGSAAERIQELLDLTEGYKEYGQLKDNALKEALAELARLKAGSGASAPTKAEAKAEPVSDDPMPDLTDPDVNFDTDKLREKTQKWIDKKIAQGTQRVVKEITGQTAAEKLEAEVNTKVAAFAATHSDWETKVAKNPVLIQNQLSPVASLAVARSENTADILYAFGNDPALAIRVAKQTPEQQLVTIGKIEAKIEAAKEAAKVAQPDDKGKLPAAGAKPVKQKSLTQAPPPPTPTKAAGRPTEREETDPALSMDDFARRHREKKQTHRAQMRKARGLG